MGKPVLSDVPEQHVEALSFIVEAQVIDIKLELF